MTTEIEDTIEGLLTAERLIKDPLEIVRETAESAGMTEILVAKEAESLKNANLRSASPRRRSRSRHQLPMAMDFRARNVKKVNSDLSFIL